MATNEIAKVTSNPNLTGQLSDSARREVEAFMPQNATLGQVYAVAKILRQDMQNRHDSLDDQIGAIQSRIGGGKAAPAALPQGAGKVIDATTAQQFYKAAGNDPAKARTLAQQNGWKVQ